MITIPTFGLEARNLSYQARTAQEVCEKHGLKVTSVRASAGSSMVLHTIQAPNGNCLMKRRTTALLAAFADGITAAGMYPAQSANKKGQR